MTKLFKPVPENLRRSTKAIIRLTKTEMEQIRYAAHIRCLSVSEFVRRAALGRKADVRIEQHIIVGLSQTVQELRALRKTMVEQNLIPPDEEILRVIEMAADALRRMSLYV